MHNPNLDRLSTYIDNADLDPVLKEILTLIHEELKDINYQLEVE